MKHLPWLLPLMLLLAACSDADSLGDEPPREVQITGTPTYTNGIGELLDLKCGYCHAWPRPDTAPNDVVEDLDLTVYATRIEGDRVIRGADSLTRWLHEGILTGPVSDIAESSMPRQMPLDYGTQLTGREQVLLEEWAAAGAPLDETPQPMGDPNQGFSLYNDNCVRCHSLGEGVLTEDGLRLGTAIRKSASSTTKIKSMWLERTGQTTPLTDEQAADIRAFIVEFLTLAE